MKRLGNLRSIVKETALQRQNTVFHQKAQIEVTIFRDFHRLKESYLAFLKNLTMTPTTNGNTSLYRNQQYRKIQMLLAVNYMQNGVKIHATILKLNCLFI